MIYRSHDNTIANLISIQCHIQVADISIGSPKAKNRVTNISIGAQRQKKEQKCDKTPDTLEAQRFLTNDSDTTTMNVTVELEDISSGSRLGATSSSSYQPSISTATNPTNLNDVVWMSNQKISTLALATLPAEPQACHPTHPQSEPIQQTWMTLLVWMSNQKMSTLAAELQAHHPTNPQSAQPIQKAAQIAARWPSPNTPSILLPSLPQLC